MSWDSNHPYQCCQGTGYINNSYCDCEIGKKLNKEHAERMHNLALLPIAFEKIFSDQNAVFLDFCDSIDSRIRKVWENTELISVSEKMGAAGFSDLEITAYRKRQLALQNPIE